MLSTKMGDYFEPSADDSEEFQFYGIMHFQHEYAHRMAINEEGLGFLTCGGIQHRSLSLVGYVLAFERWI